MIKNDKWIEAKGRKGMIRPFASRSINELLGDGELPSISYGASSYGYDIRLSDKEFMISKQIPGTVIDPKNFNSDNLKHTDLHNDKDGEYFILPANSYGLGVSLEYLVMPRNITAICQGKSTYARCGIITPMTPVESEWCGYLTLEFSNSSNADRRIYANEGVVQLLFFEGEPCKISYQDRDGKYQDQPECVVLPRV